MSPGRRVVRNSACLLQPRLQTRSLTPSQLAPQARLRGRLPAHPPRPLDTHSPTRRPCSSSMRPQGQPLKPPAPPGSQPRQAVTAAREGLSPVATAPQASHRRPGLAPCCPAARGWAAWHGWHQLRARAHGQQARLCSHGLFPAPRRADPRCPLSLVRSGQGQAPGVSMAVSQPHCPLQAPLCGRPSRVWLRAGGPRGSGVEPGALCALPSRAA